MLHGSPHPGLAGSELTRLLTRFAGDSSTRTGAAFAERLGHWLSWRDAIGLSSALEAPSRAEPDAPARRSHGAAEADVDRVRAALEARVAAGPHEDGSDPTDFGPHRRHCLAVQQAMHDAVGPLRQRLRDALSRQSPALARLAAIDAAMDRTMAARERGLLGLVPVRLQTHFERLRRSGGDGWLDGFRADRDLVLRAELQHRLTTCQGLLDALRTHRSPT